MFVTVYLVIGSLGLGLHALPPQLMADMCRVALFLPMILMVRYSVMPRRS